METWQPIETCPLDTFVLLAAVGFKKSTIGKREAGETLSPWFYDEQGEPFYSDEEPTHWMPLPDPPRSSPQIPERT